MAEAITRTDILRIDDFPDIILANVAEYLPVPSRAMLALALTTTPSLWRKINWMENSPILKWATAHRHKKPVPATKSILSLHHKKKTKISVNKLLWEVLDFGEVERSLATKLGDDDIAGILSCINAVTRLKTLKLTGCVNITGRGLIPLGGSLVLEHIDLGLVGLHEDPFLEPEPLMSVNVIAPILHSIVNMGRESSLRYIMLPRKIRVGRSDSDLDEFLEAYDQLLQSRGLTCSKCNETCTYYDPGFERTISFLSDYELPSDSEEGLTECVDGPWSYGMQGFTCHECEKIFCMRENCDWMSEYSDCGLCEKYYCKGCVEMGMCSSCDKKYCKQCKVLVECNSRRGSICDDCFEKCRCCDQNRCTACLIGGVVGNATNLTVGFASMEKTTMFSGVATCVSLIVLTVDSQHAVQVGRMLAPPA